MFVVRVPIAEAEADGATDALLASFHPETSAVAAIEIGNEWVVDAYYVDEPDPGAIAAILSNALARDLTETDIHIKALARQDWVQTSLEGLPPVQAGRFVIHGRHDRDRVPSNAIGIEIEAGLAFGTGHHATTLGCLLAIDRLLKSRRPLNGLDLGTGTGLLAIGIARAARVPVLASDIDREATRVSRENVRANGAAGFVQLLHAAGTERHALKAAGPFDLIVANILARPLIRMSTGLSELAAAGADLILSGLLNEQATGVFAAYRARGWRLVERNAIDGWTTLHLRR
ncbi:MAG: 50S ribosomal protein L11 methyltransferase [Pseudomonadota bacterium]